MSTVSDFFSVERQEDLRQRDILVAIPHSGHPVNLVHPVKKS